MIGLHRSVKPRLYCIAFSAGIAMNTVSRFNDRVVDYVRFRPNYTPEALRAILDGLGLPEQLLAADIGAGTGISARWLGDRGVRVVAIEPGEAMRQAASPHPRVTWVAGTAEAIGLRSRLFDLVVSAQSFHWFHAATALVEFARILKTGQRLAIMWNRRSLSDPFTVGYRRAIIEVGGEVSAERMSFDPEVIAQSGLFSPPERRSFPNFQRLDLDGLIGRALSASYVPKSGSAGERLLELLRTLHEQYADASGFVTLIYETEVFCSNKLFAGPPRE